MGQHLLEASGRTVRRQHTENAARNVANLHFPDDFAAAVLAKCVNDYGCARW